MLQRAGGKDKDFLATKTPRKKGQRGKGAEGQRKKIKKWPRIARVMRKVNFLGYVSLEFEGNEDYKTALPKSLALVRRAFS